MKKTLVNPDFDGNSLQPYRQKTKSTLHSQKGLGKYTLHIPEELAGFKPLSNEPFAVSRKAEANAQCSLTYNLGDKDGH